MLNTSFCYFQKVLTSKTHEDININLLNMTFYMNYVHFLTFETYFAIHFLTVILD